MEDHYNDEFDRFFARDLKQAGLGFQPDQTQWPALSARLDAAKQRAPWYLLLLWLLFPVLLVSNIWTLRHWQTLRDQVSALDRRTALRSAASLVPEHHRRIVYDTIYRTVIITRQVNAQTVTPEIVPASPTLLSANAGETTKITRTELIDNQLIEHKTTPPANCESIEKAIDSNLYNSLKINNIYPHLLTNQVEETNTVPTTATAITIPPKTAASPPQRVVHPDWDTLLAQSSVSIPVKRHRDPLRWRIGLGLGLVGTTDLSATRFSGRLSASMQGEILLGRRWAVVPGLFYAAYQYRIEQPYDESLSLTAPPPPSPDYEFRHFEGHLRHVLPSLALRYRFRPEKACSFYAGAGYALRLTLPGKADCEYVEYGTGHEFFYEIPVHAPDHLSMGLAQAGLEFALGRRWSLFGEATGMFNNRTVPLMSAQLGLKWGLK